MANEKGGDCKIKAALDCFICNSIEKRAAAWPVKKYTALQASLKRAQQAAGLLNTN
jgi:hypothetical protein